MTKYCTECGRKNMDDANFCSKCGSPLEGSFSPLNANAPLEIPKKYSTYNIVQTSRCFNCYQNTFIQFKKNNLLSDKIFYFCSNCGLTLEKIGNLYKVLDILDKNNPIWSTYSFRQLKMEDWEHVANGGLPENDRKVKEKKIEDLRNELSQLELELDLEVFTQDIIQGQTFLSPIIPPVDLMENEEAYVSLDNIKLCVPEISQNTNVETSFKIAKGVSVRSKTREILDSSLNKLKEIDLGTFIITNIRVIFIGPNKTVNIDLRQIHSINIFKDGVSIQRENKNTIEYFIGTDQHTLTLKLKGREQKIPLDGNIIRAMILGQIVKL